MGQELIQPEQIERAVLLIRGQRVMLDRDLAALYGVETKNLNKAVQRNPDRFPAYFMFELTPDEARACLASRFQFGTLKRGQNITGRQCALPGEKELNMASTTSECQFDVFLSHSAKDRAVVQPLAA
jgi:hypothetical protein